MTQSGPILQTPRLTLRLPRVGDIDNIYNLARDRRVHRFMMLPWPYRKEHAAGLVLLAKNQLKSRTGYHFLVTSRKTGEVYGVIGLACGRKIDRHAEVGYWLGPNHWGQGYASEALSAALAFAFRRLKLVRVWARSVPANKVSARMLRRAGFKSEGTLRKHRLIQGKWHDERQWGILRDEYLNTLPR